MEELASRVTRGVSPPDSGDSSTNQSHLDHYVEQILIELLIINSRTTSRLIAHASANVRKVDSRLVN